jgi:phosphonate transport system permease protein
MTVDTLTEREVVLRDLRRDRPMNRFARRSLVVLAFVAALSWIRLLPTLGTLWDARRAANLERFLGELRPFPLQDVSWDWGTALEWAVKVGAEKGLEGAAATLAISVVAIFLAATAGLLLSVGATRTLAAADPYIPGSAPQRMLEVLFGALVATTRVFLIFLRAIPEYVWAFLLIAVFGPTAWPVIIALAIHNAGILGKLDAEVVENLPPHPFAALRGVGTGRRQLAAFGLFPAALPRFLLFLFYRWETCVREATVLGMLGVVSLGFWIQDARARFLYDEMFLLILLGSAIVMAGDLVSAFARKLIRV